MKGIFVMPCEIGQSAYVIRARVIVNASYASKPYHYPDSVVHSSKVWDVRKPQLACDKDIRHLATKQLEDRV